jgi:hypothetical protein
LFFSNKIAKSKGTQYFAIHRIRQLLKQLGANLAKRKALTAFLPMSSAASFYFSDSGSDGAYLRGLLKK